jgi:hypothetical protein
MKEGIMADKERIGKYLVVCKWRRDPKKKTDKWSVQGLYNNGLGVIAWYGPWRQYTFDPLEGTTFNKECLDDISRFLERVNKEHRTG